MRTLCYKLSSVLVLAGLTTLMPALEAKDKKPPAPMPKDEIQVVGHIALTDGPVRRFYSTQHYSSYYLYAEHEAGTAVTLIDVTRTDRPAVLADVASAPSNLSGNLVAVAGTAALTTSGPSAPTSVAAPQTIKIMDFSDPKNPRVAREFNGVTAVSRDDRRGLIFIANADGIWILQQHLAEDPEVQKAYADYVRYSH